MADTCTAPETLTPEKLPPEKLTVVMLGASGAVGGHVARTLLASPRLERLTLLNRRPLAEYDGPGTSGCKPEQYIADIDVAASYAARLPGHSAAICTLGVGQPTKVSAAELVRVDRDAAIAFARAARAAGVRHFSLLGSVAADPASFNHYLRTKGELREMLVSLRFERLSIFQPSMILTPTNRYGWSQGLTLAVWPKLDPVLRGSLSRYRGVRVEQLGGAIANNVMTAPASPPSEILHWPDFQCLAPSA